jgi:hypothetical protein
MAKEEEKSAKDTMENGHDDLIVLGNVVLGKGQTQSSMKLMPIFGETTTSQVDLLDREEAAILNKIWPRSYNITFYPSSSLFIFQGIGQHICSSLIEQILNPWSIHT